MVAVHFTTIPGEPNRAFSTHRKPYFGEIHPCTNNIVYARFEDFRLFLCVFMSGFYDFRSLRITGKCIIRHLFRFGGLVLALHIWPKILISLISVKGVEGKNAIYFRH